jgi:hypothetical protein
MKVDAERRVLWACTGRFSLMANSEKFPARTGVLKYSIEDGKLLESWILDEDMASAYHIFNDLTVATNGDVYVTTTLIGRVYKISEATGKMELLLQLKEGSHNNGIDLGPNEKYLFLTVDRSIYRYDLATGEMVEIINPSGGEVLIGTDGLYFYENSLIAVKPRYNLISRIHLKEDLLTVDHVDILVQGHPEFSYPTTGVVADDTCVVVATSFVRIPRNAESTEQHPDVKIYSVPLEVH